MNDFEVSQIDHVELFVPDQRRAARWYERVFGMQILAEYESWADHGPLMLATAEAGTKLALFRGEPIESPPRAAFRRVAFRVDAGGFVAFLARLAGLDLVSESGAAVRADDWVDHDAALSIYFVDPWQHRFEITTYEPERVRQLLR